MQDIGNEKLKKVFKLDWENPPELKDLKADYEEAMSSHNDVIAYVDSCAEIRKAEFKVKEKKRDKGRSHHQPKLVRKQAEWRYAPLSEPFLSSPNLFDTEPRTYEDVARAEQAGLLLNYHINTKLDKVKLVDDYVRSAVDEGTVIAKLGWNRETAMRTMEKPIMGLVPVQDPEMAQQMMAQGMQPVQEGIVGYEEYEEETVVANHPTIEICDLRHVIIDPTCEGILENANFIIHEYETSLKDLNEDGRYKNLDKLKEIDSNRLSDSQFQDTYNNDFNFKDSARKKIIVREYWGNWDINDDDSVESILCVWVENVIIRLEENPMPDGSLPFVSAVYTPKRKSVHGESDALLLKDNQDVIGALTRGALDLMGRSANAQTGIRKDALDSVNRKRYREGADYEFNANIDPRQAILLHQYPEIPRSVLEIIQMQNNDAESLSGVKAFSSHGISGQGLGSTATAARGALDAVSKRELSILRRLAEGLVKMARKMLVMTAEFMEEEEVVRVSNKEFVRVSRDDLKGDIDIRIEVNTAESDNEKAQELSFMLQTLGNSVPFEVTKLIMADIAKLRKMPHLAEQLNGYQPPPPDPILQEREQLQNEYLKAQIAYEYSRAEENQVDMQHKGAKTQSEMAKARKTQADADLADMDFLDRESGRKEQVDFAKDQQKSAAAMAQDSNRSRNKINEDAAKQLLEFERERASNANSQL